MDLNELLQAHQIEVMKASASADDDHFGMIAEYADRIRELRLISPATAVAHDPAAPPTIIYGSYAGDSSSECGPASRAQSDDGRAQEHSENPDRGQYDGRV